MKFKLGDIININILKNKKIVDKNEKLTLTDINNKGKYYILYFDKNPANEIKKKNEIDITTKTKLVYIIQEDLNTWKNYSYVNSPIEVSKNTINMPYYYHDWDDFIC